MAGAYCLVRSNNASFNTGGISGGSGFGISVGGSGIIADNTVVGNSAQGGSGTGNGIAASSGSLVRENVVRDHVATSPAPAVGISFTNDCRIENNHVTGQSGGAIARGLLTAGSDNFVSGNDVNSNDTTGIDASGGTDNLIVGNRASGNGTDFSLGGAANSSGPVVDATASGEIPTADPLANISY